MTETSSALYALGENLKYLQTREGATRTSFAAKLGYGRIAYGNLLYGVQNIRLKTAEKIAAQTGYALSVLLDTSFIDDVAYRDRCPYREIDTLSVFIQGVRRQMNLRRISMSDICARINMDKAALSRILNGQIKNPTIKTLDAIASAVNCKLSTLLKEE